MAGKVERGQVAVGDRIKVLSREGGIMGPEGKVTKLFFMEGLQRVDVDRAYAGECEG